MSEEEVLKLKIHDLVEIKTDSEGELNQVGKVVTIDHWRRRLGVVSLFDEYAEFPYRKIVKKLCPKMAGNKSLNERVKWLEELYNH